MLVVFKLFFGTVALKPPNCLIAVSSTVQVNRFILIRMEVNVRLGSHRVDWIPALARRLVLAGHAISQARSGAGGVLWNTVVVRGGWETKLKKGCQQNGGLRNKIKSRFNLAKSLPCLRHGDARRGREPLATEEGWARAAHRN